MQELDQSHTVTPMQLTSCVTRHMCIAFSLSFLIALPTLFPMHRATKRAGEHNNTHLLHVQHTQTWSRCILPSSHHSCGPATVIGTSVMTLSSPSTSHTCVHSSCTHGAYMFPPIFFLQLT